MSLTMNVPAHIANRISARGGQKSAVTAALLKEGFAFPKISTRASRYRLVEDGTETVVGTTLDVVIVGSNPNVSKIWYSKPFDGSDGVRPDCFSHDGVNPDPSVEKPFHANCAGCPNNILGSKVTPNGAKSKICSDQRHLAVVPSADPTKVYGLTVTVSAMKGLREYVKELSNYGLIPEEVITELGFDDQASFPKITFKHKGFVPESAIKTIDTICSSDEVAQIIRKDTGAPKLAAPVQAQSLPAPTPTPEPAPAPTPAPAPAAKSSAKTKQEKPAPEKADPEDESEGGDPVASMEAKLNALFSDD